MHHRLTGGANGDQREILIYLRRPLYFTELLRLPGVSSPRAVTAIPGAGATLLSALHNRTSPRRALSKIFRSFPLLLLLLLLTLCFFRSISFLSITSATRFRLPERSNSVAIRLSTTGNGRKRGGWNEIIFKTVFTRLPG